MRCRCPGVLRSSPKTPGGGRALTGNAGGPSSFTLRAASPRTEEVRAAALFRDAAGGIRRHAETRLDRGEGPRSSPRARGHGGGLLVPCRSDPGDGQAGFSGRFLLLLLRASGKFRRARPCPRPLAGGSSPHDPAPALGAPFGRRAGSECWIGRFLSLGLGLTVLAGRVGQIDGEPCAARIERDLPPKSRRPFLHGRTSRTGKTRPVPRWTSQNPAVTASKRSAECSGASITGDRRPARGGNPGGEPLGAEVRLTGGINTIPPLPPDGAVGTPRRMVAGGLRRSAAGELRQPRRRWRSASELGDTIHGRCASAGRSPRR